MAKIDLSVDLESDEAIDELAQGIAKHLPLFVSCVEDIDEAAVRDAIRAVVSDITQLEMRR